MTGRADERSAGVLRAAGRDAQARRLVEVLRRQGPLSQAALARRIGLSPATVSNLVRTLRSRGLADIEPLNGRESLVSLVENEGIVVSVQVTARSLRAALFDFGGAARHDLVVRFDADHVGGSPDLVVRLVHKLLADAGLEIEDLVGVAVGLQAPIARATGMITPWARNQLPGWQGFAVEADLQRHFDVPVLGDNDANFAALAEWTWGVGRGCADFLCVLCSAGIGGGFVLDGRIHRGSDGLAGEVGHLVTDPSGPVCFCGSRGCLAMFASERSILRALGASGAPQLSLREVIDSARQGDAACQAVLWEAGHHLGRAIASAAKLVAPGVIAVGGILSEAGPLLFDSVNSSVEINTLRAVSPGIRIEQADLAQDAVLFGGVAAVLDRLGRSGISTVADWMHQPATLASVDVSAAPRKRVKSAR